VRYFKDLYRPGKALPGIFGASPPHRAAQPPFALFLGDGPMRDAGDPYRAPDLQKPVERSFRAYADAEAPSIEDPSHTAAAIAARLHPAVPARCTWRRAQAAKLSLPLQPSRSLSPGLGQQHFHNPPKPARCALGVRRINQ
jgi:hypothetical protein